jgi:hypothetical protein
MKHPLQRVFFALVVVLALGALLMQAGQRESRSDPRVSNEGPTGLSLLAEVLRGRGHQVVETRDRRFSSRAGDQVIVFYAIDRTPILGDDAPDPSPTERGFRRFLGEGATVFGVPFQMNYARAAREIELQPFEGASRQVQLTAPRLLDFLTIIRPIPADAPSSPVWSDQGGTAFVTVGRVRGGTVIAYADGAGLMNKYLGDGDNLDVFLGLVDAASSERGRIVFWQAGFMPDNDGLLAKLGAWAEGAWTQVVLVGLFAIYVAGKRFGLPVIDFRVQPGTVRLLDAVARASKRLGAVRFAGAAILETLEIRFRRVFRTPDRQRWPREARDALRQAEASLHDGDPVPMGPMRAVEAEVSRFERR